MTAAGVIVAGWLGPAIWLTLPALLLAQGAGGLWPGLLVVLAPLLGLSLRARGTEPDEARAPVPLVHVATFFLAVGVLIWAGLVVAGDVAARLGEPPWHGIASAPPSSSPSRADGSPRAATCGSPRGRARSPSRRRTG